MSSEPRESNPDVEQDEHTETEQSANSPALTIALPDGCESVSDAIVTNREMLREPQDHGLATEEDITHLSEAMEGLSTKVQTVGNKHEESQSEVEELQNVVEQQRQQLDEQLHQIDQQQQKIDQQQRQIDELQSMVTQLMEILGTDAEWETFDEA